MFSSYFKKVFVLLNVVIKDRLSTLLTEAPQTLKTFKIILKLVYLKKALDCKAWNSWHLSLPSGKTPNFVNWRQVCHNFTISVTNRSVHSMYRRSRNRTKNNLAVESATASVAFSMFSLLWAQVFCLRTETRCILTFVRWASQFLGKFCQFWHAIHSRKAATMEV